MANILSQIPALIGVMVGAIATIVATSLSDRTRWRRSQKVRWDERRLEAYARYADTIKRLQVLSWRMTAATRPGAKSAPLSKEAGEELMSQGEDERAKAWETLLLLGDVDTVAAGRTWRDAVLRMEHVARGLSDDAMSLSELDHEADRAREAYYAAARRSLGVGGQLPPVGELRALGARLQGAAR